MPETPPRNLPDMIVAGPGICLFTLRALAAEVSLSEEDTKLGLDRLNALAAEAEPTWPRPAIPLLPLWERQWFSLSALTMVLHRLLTPAMPLSDLPAWTRFLQNQQRSALRASLNSLAETFFQKRNTEQRLRRRAKVSRSKAS